METGKIVGEPVVAFPASANMYASVIAPSNHFVGADPIVALTGESGQIAIYSVLSLRCRWKRRRVVLQIQCFAGCRLAKTALQMYVPLRLVAKFL